MCHLWRRSLTKRMSKQRKSNESVLTAKDHMLLTIKGVQLIKKTGIPSTCGGQPKNLWLHSKAKFVPPPQPKGYTFTFSADQLIKFVATVAIQIVQPQVCYSNAPEDAADKKSSLCRRVSEAAKSQLGVSIFGNTLFDAIGSVHAVVLPASNIPVVIPEPFRFSTSTRPSAIFSSLGPPYLYYQDYPPNSLTLPNRTFPVGHLSWQVSDVLFSWVQTLCFGIAKTLDQNVRN